MTGIIINTYGMVGSKYPRSRRNGPRMDGFGFWRCHCVENFEANLVAIAGQCGDTSHSPTNSGTSEKHSNCVSGNILFHTFRHIWGRHGSVWAHTLGKRSYGLQEGF